MKRRIFPALAMIVAMSASLVPSVSNAELFKKVHYIGGMPNVKKEKAKGELEIENDRIVFWEGGKKKNKPLFSFPTQAITDVGIGRRARRRVVLAVLFTPWLLFAKKKNDVITIEFKDEEMKTAGGPSFMVKKDSGTGIKAVAEVKTGKEFSDELMYNEEAKDRSKEKATPSTESQPSKEE